MSSYWIDTHLHLDTLEKERPLEDLFSRSKETQVLQMISIGTGLQSTQRCIEITAQHPFVFATTGVHPHQTSQMTEKEWQEMLSLVSHPSIVGIGETGLDFFYDFAEKKDQEHWFRKNIQAAIELELPFCIHSRNAEEETIQILREEGKGKPMKGLIHCFSGSASFAKACLELGLYLSIPGMVTFVKSLQKVVQKLPLERLVLETDSPFLAPVPLRGQTNEPSYLPHTAHFLATLLEKEVTEVQIQTTRNAQELFQLPALF